MSKAASSPTAHLLRSSRLFSLPRPLPQPHLETLSSTGVYRASDTATLPYPTHQAIATPPAAHHRGDWGLKRPLPKKATRSGAIRVLGQDTEEHITDFGSAGDHVRTLEKWQEMGVPMLMKLPRTMATTKPTPISVFEGHVDNTWASAHTAQSDNPRRTIPAAQNAVQPSHRWKYLGPWIGRMHEGEFDVYLHHTISKRKYEWRQFLSNAEVERKLADVRRQAQSNGTPLTVEQQERIRTELRPDDEELQNVEKTLRDNHAIERLRSDLTVLMCDFLDLPAVRAGEQDDLSMPRVHEPLLRNTVANIRSHNDGMEVAPSSTHPSAGLSHLRTNAIMDNHPLWGPQARRSPVLARVVRTRNSAQGTDDQAKLGVGGVVTHDPISVPYRPKRTSSSPDPETFDPNMMADARVPELVGGNRMWVHPQSAWIDDSGRIRLEVSRGDKEAVAVKTDNVEPIHEARASAVRGPQLGGTSSGSLLDIGAYGMGARAAPRGTRENANYGHSLPDMRQAHTRTQERARMPAVEGFDAVLGRKPGQGEMDEGSASTNIRDLLKKHKGG